MGGKSGGGGGYQYMPSFSSQTTTPNPQAAAAYSRFMQRAEDAANRPYVPYTGQLVAGMSPDQLQAYEQIRKTQGYSQPFYDAARQWTENAVGSMSPENYGNTVKQYMNPYQQNVIDTTLATINNQNKQQLNELTSRNMLSGGMGGDRGMVARAALQGQQNLSRDQKIAELEAQGYSNAQAQAMAGAQLGLTGAGALAGLGTQGMQSGLAETQALLTGGAQQQALQQLGLDTAYQQWQQEQQFPYAQTSWLGSQLGAIGPDMGSTTSGWQYGPVEKKSSAGQGLAGGIMSGLGMLNNIGSGGLTGLLGGLFGLGKADGGRIQMAGGGTPFEGGLYGMKVPDVQHAQGIHPHSLQFGVNVGGSGGGGGGHDPAAMGKALAGLFTGKKKTAEGATGETPAAETPAETPATTPEKHILPDIDVLPTAVPTPPVRPADLGGAEKAVLPDIEIPAAPHRVELPPINVGQPSLVGGAAPAIADSGVIDPIIRRVGAAMANGWTGPWGVVAPLVAMGHDVGNVGVAAGLTPSGMARAAEAAPSIGGDIAGAFRSPTAKRIMGLGSDIPAEGSPAWNVGVATLPRRAGMAAPPVSPTGQAIRGVGGFPSIGTPEYAAEHMRLFGRPYAAGGRVHFLLGGYGDGPPDDTSDDDKINRGLGALRQIESSGRYGITGPRSSKGDYPYGAYQVMGANIPTWGKEAGYDNLTKDQFLADPKIQDAVARVQYQKYLQKEGGDPVKAAANWLGGPGWRQHAGATDVLGTNAPEYMRRFAKAYGADLGSAPMAYSGNETPSNAGLAAINKVTSGGNIQVPQSTTDTTYEDEQGLFMPKSMGNALLAAGLGTMASRAPTLGQAIGEGGLTGLAAYSEGQAQRQKLAMDEPYKQLQMEHIRAQIDKLRNPEEGKGHIGVIGQDMTGAPLYGWASGPNAGQPIQPSAAPGQVAGALGNINWDLKGEDFLKQLPESEQALVRGVAEGREKVPGGFGSQRGIAIKKLVSQYDPNWNESLYDQRKQIAVDFAKTGANSPGGQIVAANTAIGHLGDLYDVAESLHNGNVPLWNKVKQFGAHEFGGYPELREFQAVRDKFVAEAEKFYRGSQATQGEIMGMKRTLNESDTPAELLSNMRRQARLMGSKIMGLESQWKTVMGRGLQGSDLKNDDYEILHQHALESLDKINNGNFGGQVKEEGAPAQAAPVGAPAAAPTSASPIDKAKEAIARGAPRDAVIKRLKDAGYDASGL